MEDYTNRLTKAANIFNDPPPVSSDVSPTLKDSLYQLGGLFKKELKVWWDFTTVNKYVQRKMIPWGLSIKKDCHLSPNRWIYQRMERYLIRMFSKTNSCHYKIWGATTDRYSEKYWRSRLVSVQYKTLTKIQINLNQLDDCITTKKQKFQWDIADYQSGDIYNWQQRRISSFTPRSILKRDSYYTNRRQVSFTGSDNSDVFPPSSITENTSDPLTNHFNAPIRNQDYRFQQFNSPYPNHGQLSKNARGCSGAANINEIRYPRCNRQYMNYNVR